jgi:hypothetical protein
MEPIYKWKMVAWQAACVRVGQVLQLGAVMALVVCVQKYLSGFWSPSTYKNNRFFLAKLAR